jgi:hypothetical protein
MRRGSDEGCEAEEAGEGGGPGCHDDGALLPGIIDGVGRVGYPTLGVGLKSEGRRLCRRRWEIGDGRWGENVERLKLAERWGAEKREPRMGEEGRRFFLDRIYGISGFTGFGEAETGGKMGNHGFREGY